MMMFASHALWACTVFAGSHYSVPPRVLWSIHLVEGGQLGTVHKNTNGSFDYGPYQINSLWLPELSRYGFTKVILAKQPCANAYAAAWVLSKAIADTGSLWRGVGRYHSATPSLADTYVQKVRAIYLSLGP